jgi:hypothetical protein
MSSTLEGGDPVGQRRPGAPGKRYKSMGEAKMGFKSARKCGLCGLKGHTSRSNKCTLRKEKLKNLKNAKRSSCVADVDAKKRKRNEKAVKTHNSSSADDNDETDNEECSESDSSEGCPSGAGGVDYFNVEAVVGGPNNRGEYEVKWEGYDSSTNTWEKGSGLPKTILDEYKRRCKRDSSSNSEDDEPIAKKIQRGAYTA